LALARHINLKSVGPLASVPYLFAFVGMLVGGRLAGGPLNRYCPQLMVGCFVGGGLSLALAYQVDSLAMSLAGLSGAAFFLFGTQGPIAKVALDLAPERQRAVYIGIYNTAGQFGGLIAPAAIGFLVGATGSFASGFGLMIAGLAAASVLLLALASLRPPRSLVPPVAAQLEPRDGLVQGDIAS
jgi:MFS family permease